MKVCIFRSHILSKSNFKKWSIRWTVLTLELHREFFSRFLQKLKPLAEVWLVLNKIGGCWSPPSSTLNWPIDSLFLCALPSVSPDTRRWVPPAGSAGTGRGLQHRRWPALPGLAAHHLPRDWHQEPLLRALPEVHADRAVWDRGDPRGDCRDDRWVAAGRKLSSGGRETGVTVSCFYLFIISLSLLSLWVKCPPAEKGLTSACGASRVPPRSWQLTSVNSWMALYWILIEQWRK